MVTGGRVVADWAAWVAPRVGAVVAVAVVVAMGVVDCSSRLWAHRQLGQYTAQKLLKPSAPFHYFGLSFQQAETRQMRVHAPAGAACDACCACFSSIQRP